MKDSKASHHLREICETYEKQAAELKNLRRKVYELTRQRDKATARCEELRKQVAELRSRIAEVSQARRVAPSAWAGGGIVHRMGA